MNTESTNFGTLFSIIPVNTWFLPYLPPVPDSANYPAWTISTLSFWYLIFPFVFFRIQRLNDVNLYLGIIKCFWIQIGSSVLLCYWFMAMEGHSLAFTLAYVSKINISIFIYSETRL